MSQTSRNGEADKKHLLPANANSYERALSLAVSYGDDILPEDIKNLWNLKAVPARFLSFLAWGLHVDFWRDDLNETYKRELIGSSFAWHRRKGTPWAVKKVLTDLGVNAQIYEWFDVGTKPHTFAVEATYKGDPARVLDFLGEKTEELLHRAIEATKPERSHLLYLIVLPSWPGDEKHYCIYGYCSYGHGYLNDERIHLAPVDNASGISGAGDINGYGLMSLRSVYSRNQMYGGSRYGETFEFARLALSEYDLLEICADREFLPKECRPWRNNRPKNGAWRFGGTWLADNRLLGIQTDTWETAKSCAVYGHSSYGGMACMGPRYWKVESSGRYGYTSYGESFASEPRWEPIYEFRIEADDLILDISEVFDTALCTSFGRVERAGLVCVLPPFNVSLDEAWTDADLNVWRDDKSWVESGNWVRHFEISGDSLFAVFSSILGISPAEWKETRGESAECAYSVPKLDSVWTNNVMNTWQPGKNWLIAGTWFKDNES